MKRIREIFVKSRRSKPLDSDTFVIGLFQVVFGLWVMLPMKSFAFIPSYTESVNHLNVFAQIGELPLGFVVLVMGIVDLWCVYYQKYTILKNMEIVGSAYWSFIAVGWITEMPTSTAVPVYTFFSLFSMYEFYTWAGYCANKKLLNK